MEKMYGQVAADDAKWIRDDAKWIDDDAKGLVMTPSVDWRPGYSRR
jgi:hypothetical protein